jgi:hypothetical protein
MYNLGDDKELDRLSRDAAGRYQGPGKPDWERMEAELDKVMPTGSKRRFGGFWLLLPVLLAAGGAVYWLGSGEKNNRQEPLAQQTPAKTRESASTIPDNAGAQPFPTKTADKISTPASANTSAKPIPGTLAATVQEKSRPVLYRGSLTNTKEADRKTNKQQIPDLPVQEKNTAKQDLPAANKATATETGPVATGSVPETTPPTTAVNTPTEKPSETKVPESAGQNPEPQPSRTDLFPALPAFGKGWSVGLLAGIDKSTVKFAYSSTAGFNLGITAGYHFNKHWSVHTGAIYTFKNYKMAGKDFTPPKGSWVNYYKLENVDGDCSMWEVPLLARYSFSQRGRNSFFLSTGLSSYFMTHENYSYFFYNNNQPVTRSMHYTSSDSHILSILHFSAGYENRLSEKLSLIVEPYAKLPLSGVGLGNIQLSSFGLNFSLQLRQPAHR